jgi:hypothetical protein
MTTNDTTTTANTPATYTYRYFMSFVFVDNGGQSFANLTTETSSPITTIDQINAKRDELRRRGYQDATILSCSQLARFPGAAS